jgi:hypothetical protein
MNWRRRDSHFEFGPENRLVDRGLEESVGASRSYEIQIVRRQTEQGNPFAASVKLILCVGCCLVLQE